MDWVYDYPSWVTGSLFTAMLVGITWAGIFLTRATVHSWLHHDERANEMVGLALTSSIALFGLLLALLAVATYQNLATVSDIVDKEASAMSALYRDFYGYPQPIRGQLQDALREYARYTIEEGWDEQRRGILPKGEPARSGAIPKILMTFQPSTDGEKVVHAETLRESAYRIELSRARLSNVTVGLPPLLWWVLAVCTLLNIALIWMQDMEIHVHMILGGILAAILAIEIFLIAELDHPYRGSVSIGPDSIAHVYEAVMRPEDGIQH
jgi:hypothetical protein